MKKTFQLIHPKIKYPRRVESVKNDLRKYIKRERRKALPEEVDFWDFDCAFGDTEAEAKPIHLSAIDQQINEAEARALESFYVEIIAKPGRRTKKVSEETAPPPTPLEMKPLSGGASGETV